MSDSFRRQVWQVLTGEVTTASFLVTFLVLGMDLSPSSAPFWILAYLAVGPLLTEALRPRTLEASAAEAGLNPERLHRVYRWMVLTESIRENLAESFHGATFRVEVDRDWWEEVAHLPANMALFVRPELGFEIIGEPPKGFNPRRMAVIYRALMVAAVVLNAVTWPLSLARAWHPSRRAEVRVKVHRAKLLFYRLDLEDRGYIHHPTHTDT
jgi:hypothetical protein